MENVVEVREVTKNFGISRALTGVNLDIRRGECLGLVGHNGAGKSTLMNVLSGIFPPSGGSFSVDGTAQGTGYDVRRANELGVRTVFQELSLCLNLTVVENMRVFHPSFRGACWRRRAEAAIMVVLDTVFPGHGIRPNARVENLTLGQRQTLEISKALAGGDHPPRLLILDEPTSALDYHTAKKLLDYLKTTKGGDTAFVYISHMLDEVIECSDRIVVMKDGAIAGETSSEGVTRDKLIELMGGSHHTEREEKEGTRSGAAAIGPVLVTPKSNSKKGGSEKCFTLRQGEVVGLAGLAGHGQTDLLIDLFDYRGNPDYDIQGPLTFVPGDRPRDGNFPLWSIINNITILVYHSLRRYRLIDLSLEHNVSGRWKKSIGIRASSLNANILSLSGGNQQKVLFARCLESTAPIILMDDPTRGVDVDTKEIIYRLIEEESLRGRSFVWYTTEMDELKHCDRVYVFRNGEIVDEMPGSEATEDAVLRSSF